MRRSHLLASLVLAALLGLGAIGSARADDDDDASIRTAWQGLRVDTLERLHALAQWCTGAKLFGARADVYETVLYFEPDDATARKWLKFKREGESWVRAPRYKPPRDMGKGRSTYEEKRAELALWFSGELMPLVDRAESADDPTLRRRLILAGLEVIPNDDGLRDQNDEVKDASAEGGWILRETKRARERRPMLQKVARDAVANHPGSTPSGPQQVDLVGGVEWTHVKQGEHVRILGTVDEDELELQIKFCDATWPVFKAAFDRTPVEFRAPDRYSTGLSVYCLDNVEAGNELLAARGMDARHLEFVAPLVSCWIPDSGGLIVKWPVAMVRLEAAPKQIMGTHISRQFGIRPNRGWASEGLDHYLTWLIVGTRMIYSVVDKAAKYAEKDPKIPDYEKRIHEGGDWLAAGRLLLESPDKPNLHLMAGKDVNKVEIPEVLYGYCISAYLIEGCPEGAREFLAGVGGEEGANLQKQIAENLRMDADTFEARVRRWLFELKDLPER